MQHIIPVDFSTFPEGFHSRRLVGPKTESGIERCTVLCSRVPPGYGGPALHTHPVDQFDYTLSGRMNLQLGTEEFAIGPDTFVFRPPERRTATGTPAPRTNATSSSSLRRRPVTANNRFGRQRPGTCPTRATSFARSTGRN